MFDEPPLQIEQEIPAKDFLAGKVFGNGPAAQPARPLPTAAPASFYGGSTAAKSFYGSSSTSKGLGKKFSEFALYASELRARD